MWKSIFKAIRTYVKDAAHFRLGQTPALVPTGDPFPKMELFKPEKKSPWKIPNENNLKKMHTGVPNFCFVSSVSDHGTLGRGLKRSHWTDDKGVSMVTEKLPSVFPPQGQSPWAVVGPAAWQWHRLGDDPSGTGWGPLRDADAQ